MKNTFDQELQRNQQELEQRKINREDENHNEGKQQQIRSRLPRYSAYERIIGALRNAGR